MGEVRQDTSNRSFLMQQHHLLLWYTFYMEIHQAPSSSVFRQHVTLSQHAFDLHIVLIAIVLKKGFSDLLNILYCILSFFY